MNSITDIITGNNHPGNTAQSDYDNYTKAIGQLNETFLVYRDIVLPPVPYEHVADGVNNTSLSDLAKMINIEIASLSYCIDQAQSFETACTISVNKSEVFRAHLNPGSPDYNKQIAAENVLKNLSSQAKTKIEGWHAYLISLKSLSEQLKTMENYDVKNVRTCNFSVYGKQGWYDGYMRELKRSYMYNLIYKIRPVIDWYISKNTRITADLDGAINLAPAESDKDLYRDMKVKFSSISNSLKTGYNSRVEFMKSIDDIGLYLSEMA